MFTHFSHERMAKWQSFGYIFLMKEWPSGKVSVTFSKLNAYFPHILGSSQMYAVFSMTNHSRE